MNTKRELFNTIIEASKTLEENTISVFGDLGTEAINNWLWECREIAIRLLNVEAFTEEERKELLRFKHPQLNFLSMVNCELGGDIPWQLAEKICDMK